VYNTPDASTFGITEGNLYDRSKRAAPGTMIAGGISWFTVLKREKQDFNGQYFQY